MQGFQWVIAYSVLYSSRVAVHSNSAYTTLYRWFIPNTSSDLWRWGDVELQRCGDVKMWRCKDVKMWRWGGVKINIMLSGHSL